MIRRDEMGGEEESETDEKGGQVPYRKRGNPDRRKCDQQLEIHPVRI